VGDVTVLASHKKGMTRISTYHRDEMHVSRGRGNEITLKPVVSVYNTCMGGDDLKHGFPNFFSDGAL
jgi:hypothetical protein